MMMKMIITMMIIIIINKENRMLKLKRKKDLEIWRKKLLNNQVKRDRQDLINRMENNWYYLINNEKAEDMS